MSRENVTSAVAWYDRIAKVFDLGALDVIFYRNARSHAIDRLCLTRGDVVLDLFCGSGVNFPLLRDRIGPKGLLIGIDGSSAMLRRARAVPVAQDRPDTVLYQADFSTPEGIRRVTEAISLHRPTCVLVTLGLTCLPSWREFFRSVYEAAPVATRFSILDVYCDRVSFGARLINATAAADCTRTTWAELEERAEGFVRSRFRPFRIIDAEVYVASGRKPA